MHIRDILTQRQSCFSFEFFPPRTRDGAEQLYASMVDLAPLQPAYVSVTYGAGGSTRELTHGLILRIHEHTGLTVVSHRRASVRRGQRSGLFSPNTKTTAS